MTQKRILGILITDRKKEAGEVQKILTQYGSTIKTRLGLHEVGDDTLSEEGLILLELTGIQSEMDNLEKKLESIEGTQTQKMDFSL
ncbi:MAG: hypothetical protein ACLFUW_03810 [Bacteroidales bacterium]